MARRSVSVSLLLLLGMLLAGSAGAHAPLDIGESSDLAGAVLIPDPEKSYVIYGHLREPGGIAYYRFDMTAGRTLHAALMVSAKSTTAPDLIVMGPGILPAGSPPAGLQTPAGSGVAVIPGTLPEQAEYEPFTPAAIYPAASVTTVVPVTGTYYVAVSAPAGEQEYSLAPGTKEEFTAAEWLLVPISVIGIHVWEGQSPFIVLSPCIAVVLLGGLLLIRQQKRTGSLRPPFSWLVASAGLLYLGGASVTFAQMIRALGITGWDNAAVLTLLFIGMPVILGLAALRTGFAAGDTILLNDRVIAAGIGILGLVFWAGLLAGPVLACAAAVLPDGTRRRG